MPSLLNNYLIYVYHDAYKQKGTELFFQKHQIAMLAATTPSQTRNYMLNLIHRFFPINLGSKKHWVDIYNHSEIEVLYPNLVVQ